MRLTTNQKFLIALSACLDQLGPKSFRQLIDSFDSPEQAFNSSLDQLIKIGFSSKKAKRFIQQRDKINLEKILQIIAQEDIKIITLFDKNYPALLAEIYDPPVILFYKGKLKKREKYPLAIVGTRKISYYGQQAITKIVPDLVNCGLTIISGLAFGCDSLAHQLTLKAKGRTLAVLGTGIDKQSIYPKINQRLAQKIIEHHGALISEFPPGTPPYKSHFPLRNRIISGLSTATLVIEAPFISGALITSRNALEQNREVLAVPGSIFSRNSAGSNQLIKYGAKAITNAQDVLDIFSLKLTTQKELKVLPQNKEEKILYQLLSDQPIHIDQLVKKSNLITAQVNSTLTILEIKGLIKHIGHGNYLKIR